MLHLPRKVGEVLKYHVVAKISDVQKFKFCPFCGSKKGYLGLYTGDFIAHTECLDCDNEISFYILEEVKKRFSSSWKDKIMNV